MLTFPWHDQPSRFFSPAFPRWKWGWNCCCDSDCPTTAYFGYNLDSTPAESVKWQSYLASGDSYATIGDAPTPHRSFPMGCAVGGLGYAMGGLDNTAGFPWTGLKTCNEYDPVGDAWTAKTDFPTPVRWDGGAASIDPYVYVFGGISGNGSGSEAVDVDRLDPAADTWAAKTNMGTAKRSFAYGETGSAIVLACGRISGGSPTATSASYVEDGWAGEATDTGNSRYAVDRSGLLGSDLWVVGGNAGAANLTLNRGLGLGGSWTGKTACPTSGAEWQGNTLECTEIYNIGGNGSSFGENRSWLDDTWTTRADAPWDNTNMCSFAL